MQKRPFSPPTEAEVRQVLAFVETQPDLAAQIARLITQWLAEEARHTERRQGHPQKRPYTMR